MVNGQAGTILRHIRRLVGGPAERGLADGELLERFVASQDADSFAVLLRRHGGLVWRVCRRLLGHEQDAEDAFQATFLVLARRAASIRKGEALAGWLYGVAHRTALKARRAAARRRGHEREAGMGRNRCAPAPALRELQAVLEEEVGRLPQKYQVPFVLCCLEGKTRPEVARQLGWKEGTLSSRLAEARKRLRRRLARRGVGLSAALCATALSAGVVSAAPAAALVETTSQAALLFAASATAGPAATPALLLAQGVIKAMCVTKLKVGAALLVALSLVGMGMGVAAHRLGAEPPAKAPEPKTTAPDAEPSPPSAVKPARTDRYGDPLPEGAIARLGTVRFRHGRSVTSVAFSEDGKTLLSGSFDGTVRLWDRATGRELRRFAQLFPYSVLRVAFSPDGETAAALTAESRIRFWEVATGKQLEQLGWSGGTFSFAFAPEGKVVATGSMDDGLIRLWDWRAGRELSRLQGHKGFVLCVAFSPDGELLASASRDNTIRLWDSATGRECHRLQADIRAPYLAPQFLAFSPDGQTIACGTGTKTIRLWDTATGKERRQFREPSGEVCAIAFSPNGRVLASGSHARMCLWEVATGKELRQLKTSYHAGVPFIVFSPDGKTVATGTEDGLIHLWEVGTGQEISLAGGHQHSIWSVALSADGKVLASGSYDNDIRLWETATGRELQHIKVNTRGVGVYSVALTPDEKTLAWGGEDKIIHLWDRSTAQELRRLEGHQERVASVAFLPGGDRLVSGSGDGTIRLWDVAAGKELRRLGEVEKLFPLALSPDGKHLAVIAMGGGGPIRLLEVATGKERGQLDPGREHPRTTTAAFSPDGRTLASAGLQDPMICVWDVATRKLLRRIKREKFKDVEHTPMLFQVAFSPDGKTLVSAEEANTVFLWEVATGQKRAVLAGHQGPVHAVAFSADGRLLTTGSADTSALVWDMTGRTPQRRREAAKLTQKELRALWTDLAAADASKAYEVTLTLTAAAERSVPYLRQELRAIPVTEPARLKQLMKDLDSAQFGGREQASQELEKLGESAAMALRKALEDHSSLEVRQRVQQLLEKLDTAKSPQQLQRLRAIEVLEHIGTPEAQEVLKKLTQGAPEARLTREAKAALARLSKTGISKQ